MVVLKDEQVKETKSKCYFKTQNLEPFYHIYFEETFKHLMSSNDCYRKATRYFVMTFCDSVHFIQSRKRLRKNYK